MEPEKEYIPLIVEQPLIQISYDDHLRRILEGQKFLDTVYAHMANGGDLITLSTSLKIRYSDLAGWIQSDEERIKIYSKACIANDEFIRHRILQELSFMGFTDLRDVYNADGTLKKPKDWPENVARALQGVDVDEIYEGRGPERKLVGHTSKVKMNPKIDALKLIGQEKGLFIQKHEHKGRITLEELIGGSYEETPTVKGA